MAFRFRRTIKIAPGIKINVNKNSVGMSIGPKGAHISVNTKGQTTKSVGIPGTGLSYVTRGKIKTADTKSKSNSIDDSYSTGVEETISYVSNSDVLKSKYSSGTLNIFSKIFMVLGITLVLINLLLLVAVPIAGLIGIAFGVLMIYMSRNYSKLSKEKASEDVAGKAMCNKSCF